MQPDKPRPRAAKIADGVFAVVIRAFLNSERFKGYAENTRISWGRELRLAERPDTLGALSIHEIRPALVQAFLDGLAGRPGKQKVALAALKQVERFALVRDLMPYPVTVGCEAADGEDGGHEPWTDDHIALAEQSAKPALARIITLAANTGQRGSDVVRMRWGDVELIDGRPGINVVQLKTGIDLWIPFTQDLMRAIEQWERRPGYIALKVDGKPWTRKQLSAAWAYERNTNAALEPLATAGLHLHGLRATAVVRLRRAGASIPQIADMVGMSEGMVRRYCRKSSQKENAVAAVIMLDRTARERIEADRKKSTG